MLCLLSMEKEYGCMSQSKPNYSLARSLLTQVMALLPRPTVRLFADEVVKEQTGTTKKPVYQDLQKDIVIPQI